VKFLDISAALKRLGSFWAVGRDCELWGSDSDSALEAEEEPEFVFESSS